MWKGKMIEGPVSPIQAIKCLKGTYPEVIAYLEQHGCIVSSCSDHDLITFPTGTTEQEALPRTFESRYLVTLPDGTTCYRQCLRSRVNFNENGLNVLLLPKEMTSISL